MTAATSSLQPINTQQVTLTDRTLKAVREGIRTGTLIPGELYSVYRLAEDLGVSRSPVRDALLRLAETGIVNFERNKGFRVVLPGPKELAEMISVRISLEVPAAQRAALNIGNDIENSLQAVYLSMERAALNNDEPLFMNEDQLLHGVILKLADNSYAERVIETLRDAMRLVGASTIKGSRDLGAVLVEHKPIVDAICAGNALEAGRAMSAHLRTTGRVLLADAVKRNNSNLDPDELWERLIN
ncbi:GntR family transcriptional regulator [Glutamicibacter ardleyensis]|uniref:GntR family transcriptional regulator n=1 Tax=Glutamicibacter ardleyensis TaxID=225894 RepID=UPI003FD38AC1